MPQSNRYERQFLDALKAIFIGAKVEGESGYINLMKIKASYFESGVFPQLQKDIETACQPFESGFREELFDKLYDFFSHYFSESGSIYFRHTALHHNIYEKVYTDDRDVMLFWKTHMLYYVKTDRLFNSMEVEVDGERFFFDVAGLQHKRANEKRELTYAFKKREKDGRLLFTVTYSEKGRKTKMDEILRAIGETGVAIEEESLAKAFRVFEKQSEVDYFINKNARAFLQEQFDLWMYQYLFKGESEFNETRLKQLQAIKEIAYNIIDFIAQFEDELVRIWNKPKFVLNSHYVITLDKIAIRDATLLEKLFAHSGMQTQFAEWQELGMLDGTVKDIKGLLQLLLQKDLLGDIANPRYLYLPMDTRHFEDLEIDLLSLFDNLDATLDGWLLHSENYQALNTLLPKFRDQVKAIYIDPPYNTGTDGFMYRDKYFQASWLSMIENRLDIASQFLTMNGVGLISIDDYEMADLRLLANHVLGQDSFVCNFVWRRRISSSLAKQLVSSDHEYVLTVSPNREHVDILGVERDMSKFDQVDNNGKNFASMPLSVGMTKNQRPNQWYELKNSRTGKTYWPPEGRVWCYYPPTMNRKIEEDKIIWPEDYPDRKLNVPRFKLYLEDIKKDKKPVSTWINEKSEQTNNIDDNRNILSTGRNEEGTRVLKDLIGETSDQIYPKPLSLIQELCEQFSFDDDVILDFFAGSGTTAHAVMNLNRADGGQRKYILVEMGEHFDTVILPRVKKVAFSNKWKKGKANGGQGMSHFVKYYDLEQYEDTLRRARYEDAPIFAGTQDAYTRYVFLRDLKLLEAVQVNTAQNKVEVKLEKLYSGIDLAETLSCLTGKWIKRITKEVVEFEDGSSASLVDPEWELIKPLVWW
jgi:adenine-specific DNA-methyltransferase